MDVKIKPIVPIIVDWVVGGKESCSQATSCKGNTSCNEVDTGGHRCSCDKGYEGNPYLDPGCQGGILPFPLPRKPATISSDDQATISISIAAFVIHLQARLITGLNLIEALLTASDSSLGPIDYDIDFSSSSTLRN
ncbi:hypothetical protein L1887_42155 [Cichorium endivia]|nr:hypothetical protein L1887_42155 [Cichorium endivia]